MTITPGVEQVRAYLEKVVANVVKFAENGRHINPRESANETAEWIFTTLTRLGWRMPKAPDALSPRAESILAVEQVLEKFHWYGREPGSSARSPLRLREEAVELLRKLDEINRETGPKARGWTPALPKDDPPRFAARAVPWDDMRGNPLQDIARLARLERLVGEIARRCSPPIYLDGKLLEPGTYRAEAIIEGGMIKVTLDDGRIGYVREEGSVLGAGRFVLDIFP